MSDCLVLIPYTKVPTNNRKIESIIDAAIFAPILEFPTYLTFISSGRRETFLPSFKIKTGCFDTQLFSERCDQSVAVFIC